MTDPTNPTHECLNCHTHYSGHYCPQCGQSAATRRFTVKSVLSSTMDVWGMGTRSLPRTVWHLLTRPGQMIGDYLDGRRMPYFPPVKMLFVLCVFFALALHVSDWLHSTSTTTPHVQIVDTALLEESGKEYVFNFGGGEMSFSEVGEAIASVLQWFRQQKAISLIVLHLIFTLYTWRTFRHAPLRPGTTLAENFFIQVLVSSQLMVLSSVYVLFFSHGNSEMFYPLPGYLLLLLIVWDFKRLFGYTWLTTLWRTLLVFLFSFLTTLLLTITFFVVLALFAEVK